MISRVKRHPISHKKGEARGCLLLFCLSPPPANKLHILYKLASKGHCKVSVWVNENMLLSWIIARQYWSDELVVWQPIGWQELLLITKELLDLYISHNRVASEPCAIKSFRIYLPILAFIASFTEGEATVIVHSLYPLPTADVPFLAPFRFRIYWLYADSLCRQTYRPSGRNLNYPNPLLEYIND